MSATNSIEIGRNGAASPQSLISYVLGAREDTPLRETIRENLRRTAERFGDPHLEDPQIPPAQDANQTARAMSPEPARATAQRPTRLTVAHSIATTTTLRGVVAEGSDGEAIRRLARLGGCAPPHGAVLLAERNGEPVAAIGIMDGQAVADPELGTVALRVRLQLERLYVRLVISIRGL